MQKKAGIDDRLIFHPQRFGQRIQKLFVRWIILVAEKARGDGRHENLFGRKAVESGFQVFDVGPHRFLSFVGDGAGARHRQIRPDATHMLGEIFFVVLRERPRLICLHARGDSFFRACHRFEAGEALDQISVEARLALLAIGDNVDTTLHLIANHIGDRVANPLAISGLVITSAAQFGVHHFEQILRSRQTAGMGDENPICASLHGASGLKNGVQEY